MSEQPVQNEDEGSLKPLAIEGKLPLKAVGIENLKEDNPKHLPPHRYLHPWFARRPTPASRLAILASVLPKDTDPDDILSWMQIGPKENIKTKTISEYVEEKKATEDDRSGTLGEHYGYPRPFTRSPSKKQRESLHETLRDHWNGQLPTVVDPTAGGGVIPFEALRYGLPTKANELNPIPTLMLRILLEYAPEVGSLQDEVNKWAEIIDKSAKNRLKSYFPSPNPQNTVDCYISTHTITCPTCGSDIPLIRNWHVKTKKAGTEVVAKPIFDEHGSISYECIKSPSEDDLNDLDPKDGPVSRGGNAQCVECGVVCESSMVQEKFSQGEFRFDIYGVKYFDSDGKSHIRSPLDADYEALEEAKKEIESDYELATLLATELPEGQKTKEPISYGMTEWRDIFNPRQFLSHYTYWNVFEEQKPKIRSEYDEETAEAILSLLALVPGKLVDYNSRMTPWQPSRGYPANVSGGKNLTLQRSFPEINMSVGGMGGYEATLDKIIDSYETIVSYFYEDISKGQVHNGDAANLPYETNSTQSIVVDPPYYSSVMYSELSDLYYVWLRQYLDDVFSETFGSAVTEKSEEAVANVSQFSSVSDGNSSKRDLANNFYEQKMADIFSELYRVLEPGGVMTVMFTHKETAAWDTLTMSLIKSGFIITSTHPITSEMPQRVSMQGNASADSTLLLTGRKPHKGVDPESATPTLWSDVKTNTRTAAKEAARDLINSGLSLTKTDVIISAFGPTLRVFADAYPVVDDEDNEVPPRRALEEAREAVTQVLVDEYLDAEGIEDLDDVTEWYVLCWLVHEKQTFSYDEGRQLGLGIGVDIDDIKRDTKTWRKSRGDISLRGHDGRVQNVNEKPENRSSRTPVNPDDLSFGLALDKVHAAMHVYDVQGESACCDWLRERNFDSDSTFKATLKALLQVLPHDHKDWELARDLAAGRTRDVLDLDFSPNVFAEDTGGTSQQDLSEY
jgi:adenine-specific DNA methylase